MFGLISIGIAKSKDVLPVYIGDDQTDEDAFKVCWTKIISCTISIVFFIII